MVPLATLVPTDNPVTPGLLATPDPLAHLVKPATPVHLAIPAPQGLQDHPARTDNAAEANPDPKAREDNPARPETLGRMANPEPPGLPDLKAHQGLKATPELRDRMVNLEPPEAQVCLEAMRHIAHAHLDLQYSSIASFINRELCEFYANFKFQ